MENSKIRNFCIIAHIDHGKSTLADRILQVTGTVDERVFREQLLDDMELERERGITIKSSAVTLRYEFSKNDVYLLNLIDTPGHVDFSFEVAKSLAACEGAILVVDAVQGVEAQTVANYYLARKQRLKVIPVINKIDLPNVQINKVKEEICELMNEDISDRVILASAKKGEGIIEILNAIVVDIPSPEGNKEYSLQALIFDSEFNSYKGVIVYVRVVNGRIYPGLKIKIMESEKKYEVQEVGIFTPKQTKVEEIASGEVGYLTCNIRNPKEIINGATITSFENPAKSSLPGYRKSQPMVFCGIYPVNNKDYSLLRDALDKLKLNDASFVYKPSKSPSLGMGFRCGFLGLLHMEVIQERLEKEYGLNLVITTPGVSYRIIKVDQTVQEVDSPHDFPPKVEISKIQEPYVKAFIIVPPDCIGDIMELSVSLRGKYKSTRRIAGDRIELIYEFPLSEILVDFYDKIKTVTKGYGSLDYEFLRYETSDLVKLDVLINNEKCDALSFIVHKDKAYLKGKALVKKLKEVIPRHLFKIPIQAAIGGKIIAREDISALKKHVTGKCYGGDITRKRKLWEKQKDGKKRMRKFGRIDIPQEAFLAVLKL